MKHIIFFLALIFIAPALFAQNVPATTAGNRGKPVGIGQDERNREIILRSLLDINSRNFEGLRGYIAPTAVDHQAPPGIPPGPDGIIQGLKMFTSAFPDMKIEPIHTAADGDIVIVYSKWTGTHRGEFLGNAPTNRSFSVFESDIFRLNDVRQVVEHWSVQDMCAILNQLGISAK